MENDDTNEVEDMIDNDELNNNDTMITCPMCDLQFDLNSYRNHMLFVHPEFIAVWASSIFGPMFQEDEYFDFIRNIHELTIDADDDIDLSLEVRMNVDDMSYDELLRLCEHIGYHKQGVEDITHVVDLIDDGSDHDIKCPICLEECVPNERKCTKIKRCGHVYCFECIEEWFKQSKICPVCKQEVLITNTD